ncbi:MAG: orotate phosphoribosyltransferase [Alphaproteobacteria bacterium]|nr:MAG: orotate phosphoribosyltransferase [Alphaproteobacteria bacterium]
MINELAEKELLEVIRRRCVLRGDFTLASGAKSNTYLDLRRASCSWEAAELIGDVLFDRLSEPPPDAVAGMASGAIPLVTSTVLAARHFAAGYYDQPLEGLWVREAPKDHGSLSVVEGMFTPGDTVVLLEDVATSGGSLLKAATVLRDMGLKVLAAIALVDRQQGANELLKEHDIDFQAVFTLAQVLEEEK